jgi:hypothetical protein
MSDEPRITHGSVQTRRYRAGHCRLKRDGRGQNVAFRALVMPDSRRCSLT